MKLSFTFLIAMLTLGLNAQKFHIPQGLQKDDYVAKRLIFKVKEVNRNAAEAGLSSVPQMIKAIELLGGGIIHKSFPSIKAPGKKFNENGQPLVDLSLYYELIYNGNKNIYEAAAIVEKTGLMEHVQVRFVSKPMAVPNDPQIGQQYHHALIKTFEAWDIEEGDSTVLIGITDAGIQFDHEDLGNWAYNYLDPENGIDDDNNGYIDDIAGWNTALDINDPTATLSPHGMFTTGLSSATVNNGLGVAGNGNKCRFVPIRIDDATGFSFGYEGIIYAAERGCQIINASWGNTFYDQMAADVVHYATVTKGALLIAASGNSGLNETYYPASYPGVMSVGATGATDLIWNQSTYGPNLDIVAPGELLRSAWPFNGYDISSGTSFSAPLVAGAAAIVKSHFPSYTAQQVAERLRVTADTALFSLSGNSAVRNFMGAGRLNMLRALTDPEKPSIRLQNAVFSDGNDNVLVIGDTIRLSGELFNYLAASQNLQVSISCTSPYVELVDASHAAGVIATLASQSLPASAFGIKILPNTPYNHELLIRLNYSDAGYAGFEYVSVKVNRDYLNLTVNNIHATVTSRGNNGYNGDYATDGIGITYLDQMSMIYSSSFMLGTSESATADNAYAAVIPGYDNDFVRIQGAKYVEELNGQGIESSYYTIAAGNNRLDIKQHAFANGMAENANFININYNVKNVGTTTVTGLHAGIFSDWDIQDAANNSAAWDASRKMSYAFQPSGKYAGWVLLNDLAGHAYHFNNDGSSGSDNLYDGFSDAEKFAALSGTATRNSATGEISALIGTEAVDIAVGDSINFRFALVAGNDLTEIQAAADRAILLDRFNQLNLILLAVGESCAQNDGFVQFFTEPVAGATARLENAQAQVIVETTDIFEFEQTNLPDGIYTLTFVFEGIGEYPISFEVESAPIIDLAIEASTTVAVLPNASIEFTATSINALDFNWDFGNGDFSNDQNPTYSYTTQGDFVVTCIATNGACSDTSSIDIFVGTTVGLTDKFQSKTSLIYPNPANFYVTVNGFPNDAFTDVQIFSLDGKLMTTTSIIGHSGSIETRYFPNGIYILKLHTSQGLIMEKLVVDHQ
jgi:serine protease